MTPSMLMKFFLSWRINSWNNMPLELQDKLELIFAEYKNTSKKNY